jgi:hypothetical protein
MVLITVLIFHEDGQGQYPINVVCFILVAGWASVWEFVKCLFGKQRSVV